MVLTVRCFLDPKNGHMAWFAGNRLEVIELCKPKNPSLERVHARKKIPTGTKFTGRCLLPLKWLHRLLACGFGPHGGAAGAAHVAASAKPLLPACLYYILHTTVAMWPP